MNTFLDSFVKLKAIDVTAFIGVSPWRLQASATPEELVKHADRLGLSGLCVSHLASVFGYDTRSGNEELAQAIGDDKRFWLTPVINPTEPGWRDELSWAQANHAPGIRIVPSYHGYTLQHPQVDVMLNAVRDAGVVLHLSVTLEDPREYHPRFMITPCTPSAIADFLRAAVDLPIILSGLRVDDWSAVRAHLHPNYNMERLLLDTWRMNGPVGILKTACDMGYAPALAYGTCQPIQDAVASAFQLATATINGEDRKLIAGANTARIFDGISSPA